MKKVSLFVILVILLISVPAICQELNREVDSTTSSTPLKDATKELKVQLSEIDREFTIFSKKFKIHEQNFPSFSMKSGMRISKEMADSMNSVGGAGLVLLDLVLATNKTMLSIHELLLKMSKNTNNFEKQLKIFSQINDLAESQIGMFQPAMIAQIYMFSVVEEGWVYLK